MSASDPPKGWHALSGVLEPDSTIYGCLARGDEMRGRCHRRDCRRTCEVDFTHLAATGHGRLHVDVIKRLLHCQRIDGCSLDFAVKKGPGLPLRTLTAFPHVSVRFKCPCGHSHASPPAQVMARLAAAGGEAKLCGTVEALARVTKAPCPKCNKVAWSIDVLWPNVNSVGYRRAQQQG